jgi:hypothetical protein
MEHLKHESVLQGLRQTIFLFSGQTYTNQCSFACRTSYGVILLALIFTQMKDAQLRYAQAVQA